MIKWLKNIWYEVKIYYAYKKKIKDSRKEIFYLQIKRKKQRKK